MGDSSPGRVRDPSSPSAPPAESILQRRQSQLLERKHKGPSASHAIRSLRIDASDGPVVVVDAGESGGNEVDVAHAVGGVAELIHRRGTYRTGDGRRPRRRGRRAERSARL